MIMPQPHDLGTPSDQSAPPARPMCLACGRLMRLASIAPHDRKQSAEIRAYDCQCGYEILETVDL
jgi:hypothetical protein